MSDTVYIDGQCFTDEEDYWKLLADIANGAYDDYPDEQYNGLTVEERNR